MVGAVAVLEKVKIKSFTRRLGATEVHGGRLKNIKRNRIKEKTYLSSSLNLHVFVIDLSP
jgi:hypothetical protein